MSLGVVYYFRTAAPFWGQTSQILSSMSPKRDSGSKGVKRAGSFSYTVKWRENNPGVRFNGFFRGIAFGFGAWVIRQKTVYGERKRCIPA